VHHISNKIEGKSFDEEDLGQFSVIEILIKEVEGLANMRPQVQLQEKLRIPQCYTNHVDFQQVGVLHSSVDEDFSIESPPESSKEDGEEVHANLPH
jgi:protein-arginine kinase activator protein McsA